MQPSVSSFSSASEGPSFLIFPPELRLKIYSYALSWPDLVGCFRRWQQRIQDIENGLLHDESRPGNRLIPKSAVELGNILPRRYTTPTCLLLCRQITAEALPVLYAQPLRIEAPSPYSEVLGRPVDITHFISEAALQRACHVVLKMDLAREAASWRRVVDLLLDVWQVDNALVRLEVVTGREILVPVGYGVLGSGSPRSPSLDIVAKLQRFGIMAAVQFRCESG
ncbi:hypothetical protein F4778DRAFT_784360 [Xylariomycetidae sp. FL2044]|nr:hypothetical protein F4778DRAFT_784360 [Xylariomycetidae sp. FL2044]